MREQTRKNLEKRVKFLNDKIVKKEEQVENWNVFYLTGLVGLGYGMLSLDKSKIMAGCIVSMGGLVFKAINAFRLADYEEERDALDYGLKHPDSVMEFDIYEDDEDEKQYRK